MILLVYVFPSIPVYFLFFFKAPSSIIYSLESIFSNFFGGCEDSRKMSSIKWDTLCLQWENGGLGVRRSKKFNLSLVGKWVWKVLEERECL